MTSYSGEDRRSGVALSVLRLTLLAVISVCEQLIDARQEADSLFFVVLALAAGYSLAGIAAAFGPPRGRGVRAFVRAQPALDVLLLAALAYSSGGAFSDVRKAFFVIPLAAAFSERPRSTAWWSLLAVVAFTLEAILARGHLSGALNTWQKLTFNQDLYLAWTGAAATMLAVALRRRTAQIEGLAQSRQRLVTHAIDSVERERTRLASALHDSPVQNLIAARHDLRRAQRSGDPDSFVRVHEALDETIRELREEIFNLHPHVLDHVGLKAALEQVARRHSGDSKLTVSVDVDPAAGEMQRRQVLFALGRELLGNAVRHARASEIRLSLQRDRDRVRLLVDDNGQGIPQGRTREALLDGHIGLAAVTERVAALGGSLMIVTEEGAGTRVQVTLPVVEVDEEPATSAVQLGELEARDRGRDRSQPPDATARTAGRRAAESGVSDRATPRGSLWVSTT